MGHKVAETTRNINTAFGPGTANKHIMQWLIKSFAKENRDLKMRSTGVDFQEVGYQELTATNWKQLSKLIILKLHENLPKNSVFIILWSFEKIGKVKKLSKWVPHELTEKKKKCCFEVSSSLIVHNNNKPFLDQNVLWDEKWILYNNRQ